MYTKMYSVPSGNEVVGPSDDTVVDILIELLVDVVKF